MDASSKGPTTAFRLTGLRRVDWVRIEVGSGEARCEISGVGHRMPVRRPVSLTTARALHRCGVPTVVVHPPGAPSVNLARPGVE